MLVPNRNFSSPEYRYGFQGQEKDDEVKGSGNSINYKYRMHDPRVGRFFAVDPLFREYSDLTPYQFSSNAPIHAKEFEGKETGFDLRFSRRERAVLSGKMTPKQFNEANKAEGVGALIAGVMLFDIYVTKGALSRNLAKQYVVQVGLQTAENLIFESKFNLKSSLTAGFGDVDLADGLLEIGLSKLKIGKIQKAVEYIIPALVDITLDGEISVAGSNKKLTEILTDIVGNIVSPTNVKINNNKIVKKVVETIIGAFKSKTSEVLLENLSSSNPNGSSTQSSDFEIKKDNIPNIRKVILDVDKLKRQKEKNKKEKKQIKSKETFINQG